MTYVFFAHGFEEIEAITALDILRRAEVDVQSVGVGSKTITGAHGITVHCDILDKQATPKELEMIVLPGGMPGTLHLEKSPIVQGFIDFCAENDLYISAICAAPSILGHRGLLDGKTVTCFPGMESQLGDAKYTGGVLEQDGKIITGRGPGCATEFSLRLVQCLCGEERTAALRASLQ